MEAGATDRIEAILKEIEYRRPTWKIVVRGSDDDDLFLQVVFVDEIGVEQRCRKWRLSRHMTKNEVVQTAFKAALAAEEHEAKERFFYRGRAIYNPHVDVDRLHDICECLDLRESPKTLVPTTTTTNDLMARARQEIEGSESAINDMLQGFDPNFPCIYCELPVGTPSVGGLAICPSCDCGYNRDGTKWTTEEFVRKSKNAMRRIEKFQKSCP